MLKSINAYLYLRNEYGLSEDELDVAKDFKRQNYRWKMILSTDEVAAIGDWIILRRRNQRDLAESMMRRNWGSMKKETTPMYDHEVMNYELRTRIDELVLDIDGSTMTEPECAIVYKTIIDSDMIAKPMSDEVIKKLAFLVVDIRRRMIVTFGDMNIPTPLYKLSEEVQGHLVVSPYASEIEMANLLNQRLSMRGAPHMTKFEEASIIMKIKDGFFGDRINPDSIVIFICDGRTRIDNNAYVLTQPKTEG